jgi:hypothetical protein
VLDGVARRIALQVIKKAFCGVVPGRPLHAVLGSGFTLNANSLNIHSHLFWNLLNAIYITIWCSQKEPAKSISHPNNFTE